MLTRSGADASKSGNKGTGPVESAKLSATAIRNDQITVRQERCGSDLIEVVARNLIIGAYDEDGVTKHDF
jgi:hypothetical protein